MKRSILIIAIVAALGAAASLVMGHVGDYSSGTSKGNVEASMTSHGVGMAEATYLTGSSPSDTTHPSEATTALATSDSRLDNYRLERDSCCIGND